MKNLRKEDKTDDGDNTSTKGNKSRSTAKYDECSLCDYVSQYPGNMKRHMVKRHNIIENGNYRCEICGNYYTSSQNLENHVKLCSTKTPKPRDSYECTQCDYVTAFSGNLKRHMYTHHKSTEQFIYKSACCDILFDSVRTLKSHRDKCPKYSSITEGETAQDSTRNGKVARRRKIRAKTDDNLGTENETCLLVCGKCSEVFQKGSEYKLHIQNCPCAVRTNRELGTNGKSGDSDSENDNETQFKTQAEDSNVEVNANRKKLKKNGYIYSEVEDENAGKMKRLRPSDIDNGDDIGQTEKPENASVSYQCERCENKFEEESLLQTHIDEVHSCVFMSPGEMRIALSDALAVLYETPVEEDLEKYRCKLCNIICLDATAFDVHMNRHR